MKLYAQSRRQDLLFGTLVSTLAIFAASLGTPQRASAIQPSPRPLSKPFPLPKSEDEPTEESPGDEAQASVKTQRLSPPDIDEPPQIAPPGPFTQPPDAPRFGPTDLRAIPSDWSDSRPGHRVYDPTNLDEKASPTYQAKPVYPGDLRRQGIGGQVVVTFVVDPEGRVRSASVLSSTNRQFESAALDAVAKWRFHAGRKDGISVFSRLVVPIEFKVEDR